MDSVYIVNKQHITFPESINSHIDNIPDTVLVEGLVSIKDIPCSSQLDSIINIGNNIVAYGAGFNDSISTIVFPLIIAVFAFALPFLFSAINHVNDKYNSIAIANMFKSSKRYNAIWRSIAVNIGAMLLYGGLSLLPFITFHRWIGVVFPYLFIVLSAWMVVSIFLFMQYYMTFNKPHSVVDEIKNLYSEEKADAEKKDLKLSKKLKKSGKKKSVSGKKVWEMIGSMYVRSYSNVADLNIVNRLSEMCRYAIRENDYNLYTTIWSKISELRKVEMLFDDSKNKVVSDDCQKRLTNSFLLKTCECIGESAINVEIQSSLIRMWLQCFAHDKYPNHIDFHLLMRTLFKIAGKGNMVFIEKYFADSKYSFKHVLTLPQVLYVKGGDTSKIANEEKNSREKWNEIRDYHFILAAFAFYMGLQTLPKQMMSDELGIDLLPQNRQDLLLTYARCKSKMRPDGGYDHLNAEELYGKRIDPDYIDIFAVLMFALLSDAKVNYYFLYATKELDDKINIDSRSKCNFRKMLEEFTTRRRKS